VLIVIDKFFGAIKSYVRWVNGRLFVSNSVVGYVNKCALPPPQFLSFTPLSSLTSLYISDTLRVRLVLPL